MRIQVECFRLYCSEIKSAKEPSTLNFMGTFIVMCLYVLLNFIFLYAVPVSEMQDAQGNPIIEIGSLAVKILGTTETLCLW